MMNRAELMRRLHRQCVNCKHLFACREGAWSIIQDDSGICDMFAERKPYDQRTTTGAGKTDIV